MDDPIRNQLAQTLRARQGLIAETWYAATAQCGSPRLAAAQVRQEFVELTEQVIDLLTGEAFDISRAEQIGASLTTLHHTRPESLGHAQQVLAQELLRDLDGELIVAFRPALAALLAGVATGYLRESVRIVLSEQESIRAALVTELRAAERRLQAAHDFLEEEVAKRTDELRASEEQWRALVEDAPDLISLVDRSGRLLYANRAPPGLTKSVPEFLGKTLWSYVVPSHRRLAQASVEQVFATGTGTSYEVAARRPGGTVMWYSVRVNPLKRNGDVVAALSVARDITDRKRREETIEGYVRDAAHELRSPLAKMQMSLDLLLEKAEQDEVDRQGLIRLGTIALNSVQSLVQTVDAVLDLARLEAMTAVYRKEPCRPGALVQDAVLDMEPLAEAKGLSLVAEADADLPPVEGDPEKLDVVLRNLIDNAVKFSSQGRIVVGAEGRHGGVEFSVSDSGCGILPENLERVFDRFFQERTHVPGAGVGLSTCKIIVEAHGGTIWAESHGRQTGTTVRFRLPGRPQE